MTKSLSRIAPVLPLLLTTAVFTSDTGKELAQVAPAQSTITSQLNITPLEFEPVAAVCSADTELTLQPAEGELSSRLTCAGLSEREVAGVGSYSCIAYSWGWKCFYPDQYCYFFYTGGVYCYPYNDGGGW